MTKIKWKQIIFSSLLLGIIPISTLNINEYKSNINQNIKNESINLGSTNFLTKLKNDNVQKLNSNQYVGFRLNDINNSTSQDVFIPNDNLIYDPSRLVSLKNQIVNATNEIDNKMVASFVNESELIINELNNFVVIEGVKPFLEYLPVWDPLKAKEPWSSVQNFKFKYSTSSIYGTGESDWITEDPNVFFQNQVGRTYNTFTVLINFVPLMGEIKLEVPAGYKQSKLFVPANISSPNENGEFTFKVGNKGSDYFDMSNIINMNNSAFRTGFVIKAKYLPKLKINTSDLSISNLDYNVPQNNLYDPRYSYLYLKTENDWNLLKDCSEFLSYREQKINLLIKLKESSKYKPYIYQYLSDSLNITNNQIASEVKIVSDKYKIQQYSHLVPTNIYNSYSSYTISNNTLNDIRYYSNVSNLIADQIILDPNYGIKQQNKNSDSVYDKTDYENLALVFKFKNNFLDLLNLIDNYNYLLLNVRSKLMSVLNEEELKKILIPLWSFKYDLREFNNNIDDLINKLENQLWEEDKNNVVIEKINKIFNQNYLINNENLMFFHDLPLLFKNFYDQLTIQATISYVDQPSKIINIFENKNFNSINFDDETLSLNKNCESKNIASLNITNFVLKNNVFTFENKKLSDLTKVCEDYPICDSINVSKNYINYTIKYRHNFDNIKPINYAKTSFKITQEVDNKGFLASDYLDTSKEMDKKYFNIERTLKNNFQGNTSTINFNANDINVLDPNLILGDKLNKLINLYNLDLMPNNFDGSFYVKIKIHNSNDLQNFGNELSPEIIPNKMWFVEQDIQNPKIRTYLFKLEAAAKSIPLNKIKFKESNNKNLCMQIETANNVEEINLNFKKDELNNILQDQIISLPNLPYLSIEGFDNQIEYSNLVSSLEIALTNLGFIVFKNTISINFHTNEIRFKINEANKLTLEIVKLNSNEIKLRYWVDNNYDDKYLIKFQIDEINQKLVLKIATNIPITKSDYDIYIKNNLDNITNQIVDEINKSETLNSKNLEVANLKIDFLNQTNEINFKEKTTNSPTNNIDDNSIIILCVVILIVILFITTIGYLIYSSVKRKKK